MIITRDTSREAYNTIRENGWLSKKRWEAYAALFHSEGDLTHNELQQLIEENKTKSEMVYRNNIVARLGECRDMGVVKETGERVCSISGMTCITWDVTCNLPVKFKKSRTRGCVTNDIVRCGKNLVKAWRDCSDSSVKIMLLQDMEKLLDQLEGM